jgi:MFS family permease
LLFGYLTVAASTSIFMFGHSIPVFIVARVCQGLSGAVIGVLGLAMIADTARPEILGEYMAYGSLSFTWGMLTGPVLGGVLYALPFQAFSDMHI